MKRVILTVGPRNAGKSTFCKKVVAAHPDVILVSRDAILNELFGTVWLSPYTGEHETGKARMWEILASHLTQKHTTIILDCWNGFPKERTDITAKLRELGVEKIGAWYFVTPQYSCILWNLKKEPIEPGKHAELKLRWRIDSCRRDYQLFHSQPVNLNQGFDAIHQINPLKLAPNAAPL